MRNSDETMCNWLLKPACCVIRYAQQCSVFPRYKYIFLCFIFAVENGNDRRWQEKLLLSWDPADWSQVLQDFRGHWESEFRFVSFWTETVLSFYHLFAVTVTCFSMEMSRICQIIWEHKCHKSWSIRLLLASGDSGPWRCAH